MHLLNVGDVALLDEYLTKETWDIPKDKSTEGEVRMLFNWEFPIGDAINPQPRVSGPRYKAHSDAISIIRNWVPSYAALANNHVLDAGKDGLLKTMETLKAYGFTIIGAGQTEDEISRPVFWETSEGKLAIVNWVFPETHPECSSMPGPNCWPGPERAQKIISELKDQADWVLVRAHWSDEAFSYPRPEDREMAKLLASMGADVVVSDHSHVVRGMEVIGNCPVYYGIGNYYFSHEPTYDNSWNQRALRNHIGLGVLLSFKQGEPPVCKPQSFLKLKKQVIFDPAGTAANRLRKVSMPLQQYHDDAYVNWYAKKRAAFTKWGYRLHFRLWNLSGYDLKRLLLKPFNSIVDKA